MGSDENRNAQLQADLQASQVSTEELKARLASLFDLSKTKDTKTREDKPAEQETEETSSVAATNILEYIDLQPASGQMRLPNNAYDALRNHTQQLLDQETPHSEIFDTQLTLLGNIPIFKGEVTRLRTSSVRELSEYARSRLLRLPAVGLKIKGKARATPSASSPLSTSPTVTQQRTPVPGSLSQATSNQPATNIAPSERPSEKQKGQRDDYIKMQREREQKQRDERERIKAQIKADREERRRLDDMRKGIVDSSPNSSTNASTSTPSSAQNRRKEVRVQVRTFDGSTLRSTFQPSATLSANIRPWIDDESGINTPYNLKLILTPLPNHNIEAAEEEQELSVLGIVGSCTLVMVPVKGYVESYTGSSPGGLIGSAVSGGFSLVTGTAGAVFGGVKSILGYSTSQAESSASSTPASADNGDQNQQEPSKVRVRTLADQRAETAAKRRDHQLYNGNQLNFEPKKDGDGGGGGDQGLKRD